jgi:hypothetical protein
MKVLLATQSRQSLGESGTIVHESKGEVAMTPNLPKPMRIAYFAIGVILVISPLLLNLHPWIRVGAPIMGVLAILNAATGW